MRIVAALLLVEIAASSPAAASSDSQGRAILRAAAHAMGRLDRRSAIEAEGRIDASGLSGRYSELTRVRDGAFVTRSAYRLFSEADGYDGRRRWKQDRSGASHWLNAPFTVAASVTSAWLHRRGYLDPNSARVEKLTHETVDGRPATVLTMHPHGGSSVRLAFDDASHLLVRVQRDRPLDTVTETYGDYRRAGGFKAPFHIEIEESGDLEAISIDRYVRSSHPVTALFSRPPPPHDTVMTSSATMPLGQDSTHGHGFAVVPATINGHKYDFILDTGGHNIITPAVLAELGLKSEGKGTSGGSGPGRAEVSDTQIAELNLGSATMTNQHFTILDMGNAVKRENMPPMAGILGLEIFERMAVTIDEPGGRLTIEPFKSGRRCDGDRIPLLFDDDQPSVRGKIDGIPALIGIDVGNGGIPIVLWRWAEAHKVADRFRNGKEGSGSGVGGNNTTYRTSHHDVVIGRTAIRDTDVNYATTPTGYFSSRADSMNLGRSLLQKYAVRFDYSRGEMCVIRPRVGS
jgi:hypothetical protein